MVNLSSAELRRILGDRYESVVDKPSKYGNKKVELDGYVFDSKLEAKRYAELCMLVRAEHLLDVLVHTPTIRFRGTSITYTLDFMVLGKDGKVWCEDVKGMLTKAWRIKWKMARAQHPELDLRYLVRDRETWAIKMDV